MKFTWLAVAVLCWGASAVHGQQSPELQIEDAEGEVSRTRVSLARGYAVVGVELFEELGWTVVEQGDQVVVSIPNEITVRLRLGTPFFTWDGIALQLADAPYRDGSNAFVPLQLLSDFLPRRLPDLYEFDGTRLLLRAGDLTPADEVQVDAETEEQPVFGPSEYDGVRVVVIDAGHGGADPGALGVGGVREKDVSLGIALELARILRAEPQMEVHLIREDDRFVDLWDRGEIATNLKGERYGLFLSIHGNSFPEQRSTRGFETYFLSEARTEHERRVSAIENAPLRLQGQAVNSDEEPDLRFILGELRNLDHQHWSALLAEMAQEEL
ncbi:MAG: N-acetylmuramoyl-L-alanine amidase, partial [Gemmatimonadota bacterium]|nr:N-acetylmuramoyl-L-alanine amidase [Gemmatimonadota bacterium]